MNYHLLSAKKKSGNKSSNYTLSLDKNDFDKKSINCVGNLRSNFLGTKFNIYDAGMSSKAKTVPADMVRTELGLVKYVN